MKALALCFLFVSSLASANSGYVQLPFGVGASGPAGPAGPQGPKGVTGQTGSQGASGATGQTGASGFTGATGQTGNQGAMGASGNSGFTGQTGASGFTGSTGQTGASGSSGASGLSGVTGSTGQTGTSGATGSSGSSGASGASGASGSSGATGQTGASGATGQTGASGFTGQTGQSGASGATGQSGPGISMNGTPKTTNYQMLTTDSGIEVNCATACTITMPAIAASFTGKNIYQIVNVSSAGALVTIAANSGETFCAPAYASVHTSTLSEAWQFESDNTNWQCPVHFTNSKPVQFNMTITSNTGANPTLGSGGTATCWWERIGATIREQCAVDQTNAGTGGNATGIYLYPVVPSPHAISSTVVVNGSPTTANSGGTVRNVGQSNNSSDNPRTVDASFYNTTNVDLEVIAASIFFLGGGGGTHPLSATTVHLSFQLMYPASTGGVDWEP